MRLLLEKEVNTTTQKKSEKAGTLQWRHARRPLYDSPGEVSAYCVNNSKAYARVRLWYTDVCDSINISCCTKVLWRWWG